MAEKETFYLLDGHNFLYRLFYAVPEFTTSDGTPVNAVFGMTRVLMGILREDRPSHIAVVFDSRTNFREQLYAEYKGTRDRMPDNLRGQESIMREMIGLLGIPVVSLEGYEADDIIGTLATHCASANRRIAILSSDKDLLQFVDDSRVVGYDPMKKKLMKRADVIEKFGVPPEFVGDYLAIVGDTSDNIPGIPGFGPKKAQTLIGEYGPLENIYANIDAISGKTRETLIENEERAFLSKKLATIDCNVPIPTDNDSYRSPGTARIDSADFREFLGRYEFHSLLPRETREMRDFNSLGLEAREIASQSEADETIRQVSDSERVGFATWGRDIECDGIALTFDGQHTFLLPATSRYFPSVLAAVLACDTLTGYDLKDDLRRLEYARIWGYAGATGGQTGLF
ncbi:MAG TPA: 5'-3' exonuclease H3TH domain-containing protein [bacterium]|nr:5'-3' exonuclease H3TH domain-containing protein [bacterium]